MSAEHPTGPTPARSPAGSGRDQSVKNPWPFIGFILVLCALGWLLVSRMSDSARTQDCGMSGRKDCVPIDPALGR